NELTPAIRRSYPPGHPIPSRGTTTGSRSHPMCGLGSFRCRCGGISPRSTASTAFISPAIPAAASRCPTFVFTDPSAKNRRPPPPAPPAPRRPPPPPPPPAPPPPPPPPAPPPPARDRSPDEPPLREPVRPRQPARAPVLVARRAPDHRHDPVAIRERVRQPL